MENMSAVHRKKSREIIFATGNQGKIKEIREIMQDFPGEIRTMREIGFDGDIDENGTTFEMNSEIKARAVLNFLNSEVKKGSLPEKDYIIMADDSGLEIDYLDGAPGVYSSRFLGEDSSYEMKNKWILDQLAGVPEEQRGARFTAVITAILPDGRILKTRASMEGRIADEIKGNGGFGYDPVLFLPEYGCTSAELAAEEKNRISHRGKALQKMSEELRCQ